MRIFNTDAAILEAREERQDLPCDVTPVKPVLGLDLRFHSGYEVTVPLRELAGAENLLTMIFRVTPENGEPVYFSQRINVPSIEADAKGDAYLQGAFDLGEGKYHVDWLMRDRSERVCSSNWQIEAALPSRDRQLEVALPPGALQAAERDSFHDEPSPEKLGAEPPLSVKVIVNFAPQNSRSATLQPLDTSALLAVLRSIAREPRIGKFTLVAFNVQEQRVVYRQDAADHIDFPALGEALQSLSLGTVDLRRLSQKHGETSFLASLITREVLPDEPVDAVIFAGPKVLLEENVPDQTLKVVGEPEFPIFYMNYNLHPQSTPWRDAIGNAVKFFKGTEYTISRPRDLWYAWTEIVSRMVKSKFGRRAAPASSQ
ncbi:MAG: acetyltransferase [Acidobacteria bacterium]|nr:acetyltransferase [Acidobacteriota bacterium]